MKGEVLHPVGVGFAPGVSQEVWDELPPARPVPEFPGRFELTHPPGQRAYYSRFGVDPGEALASSYGSFKAQVLRFNGRSPVDWRELVASFEGLCRDGRHVFYLLDPIVLPATEGASLLIQVTDERGAPALGSEVRAR